MGTCVCDQRRPSYSRQSAKDETKTIRFFNEASRALEIICVLQTELEKEIKKIADRQAELSADVQTMRKDVGTEFDKYNSSQIVFRKQLQVHMIRQKFYI